MVVVDVAHDENIELLRLNDLVECRLQVIVEVVGRATVDEKVTRALGRSIFEDQTVAKLSLNRMKCES